MSYLLAIVLPPVALLMVGKPFQAALSLLLMVTLIGWIPAAIWAVLVVNGAHADARSKRLEKAIRESAPLVEPPVHVAQDDQHGPQDGGCLRVGDAGGVGVPEGSERVAGRGQGR